MLSHVGRNLVMLVCSLILLSLTTFAYAEVAVTPDQSTVFVNSIREYGFKEAMDYLRAEGLDLIEAYPSIRAKVSLKHPQLVGYFILKVNLIGKHFPEFVAFYESLPKARKKQLRREILDEEKLELYIKQTREDLAGSITPGPIYDTVEGYLDSIEVFLKRLHKEESELAL